MNSFAMAGLGALTSVRVVVVVAVFAAASTGVSADTSADTGTSSVEYDFDPKEGRRVSPRPTESNTVAFGAPVSSRYIERGINPTESLVLGGIILNLQVFPQRR